MKLGLFGINQGLLGTDPSVAVRVARAAEAAGFDSVWTGEHYVLPDPALGRTPAPPETPLLDPFVALTNIAAHTSTLQVGTGVTVVPVHQPLVLAKKVASLDRVSSGRFLFGVGAGYLGPEFDALGVPLAGRGERMDEYLDAMALIWDADGFARFDGQYVSYAQVMAEPRPIQRPGPPLHVGGYAPASYRRAVTRGHGWYGFALDVAGTEACVADLRKAEARHERPDELGPLEISITPHPKAPLDEAGIAAFAELGVTRLIVLPPREPRDASPLDIADGIVAHVEDLATVVA